MTEFQITHEIHQAHPDIREKLTATTIEAINESSARSAEDAARILRHKLGEIGVQMSEPACLAAIERIRSGKQLRFEVEPAPEEA
ncbi:hypothetical protein [Kribbella solani]|uniref:Uncharacterized protein n=1 Tax=Kribbella solani TaxID=236067 RepID=A0A841DH46_9ACTN|nr:hypothetical protein [Kribbella solani]MBB5977221.1 hypothetical protein [Kribbella solani]MDX2972652.1 hypothetical protein [Kribbella solani]MDX3002082.1 hypothetical protein [Kribbella solani]